LSDGSFGDADSYDLRHQPSGTRTRPTISRLTRLTVLTVGGINGILGAILSR
jgi:hypothetical protein